MFRTILLSAAVSLAIASRFVAGAAAQEPQSPDVLVEAPPLSVERAFWLGVECESVGEALRAQLKLEEGKGLMVRQVFPDSPAAKAGIQANDVLVRFNETSLGEISDLARAVADAKDRESTLVLIRGGEAQELKVAPQPRPATLAPSPRDARLRQFLPFEPGDEPFRMLFLRPGMVGPFGVEAPELPKESSLTITREADGPAKITFRKGDQTWEATAEKIDDLPEEVRPFARRALGVGNEWEVEVRGPEGANFRKGFRAFGSAQLDPNVRVEKLRLFRDERKVKEGEAQKARADAPPEAAEAAEAPEAAESTEAAVGELRRAVQELRLELQQLRLERRQRDQ
jgi:membrane-associated protease RseP (regulator of RpoE activity)